MYIYFCKVFVNWILMSQYDFFPELIWELDIGFITCIILVRN